MSQESRPSMIPRFVLCAALVVMGCAPSGGRQAAPALQLGEITEPSSLNPLLLEGLVSAMVGSLLYSYLVTNDAQGNLVPDAAEAVPTLANGGISRDGLRVTYHLRPGIRWHDGVPLTARDCAFTFRAIMNPRNNVPDRHGYDQIASVETAGDTTVVLHLRRPYSPITDTFLALDNNYPILPAHLLAGLPNLNALDPKRYTIGSGPFTFVEWQRGDHLTLAANAAYFRGPPGVSRMVIRIVPAAPTMLNQLRTHELDAALSLNDPSMLGPLRSVPGLRVTTRAVAGVLNLYLNTRSGPGADVRVRRALARAIDVDLVTRRATHGLFDSTHALRGLFGAYASDERPPRFDPAAARALLDAAGWKTGPDGTREKDGRRLSLVLIFLTGQPIGTVIATEVQAELRAVGVDLALRGYAPAQFIAPAAAGGPMFGGRFDLALANIFAAAGPDSASFFICSERSPVGFNISRLCDPRLDARFEDAIRSYDPARGARDVAAIQQLLIEDAPQVTLGQVRGVSAYTDRLRGVEPNTVTPYAGAWRWRFVPAR
jgi:peptide/nickel transport system substrate-binding protein